MTVRGAGKRCLCWSMISLDIYELRQQLKASFVCRQMQRPWRPYIQDLPLLLLPGQHLSIKSDAGLTSSWPVAKRIVTTVLFYSQVATALFMDASPSVKVLLDHATS